MTTITFRTSDNDEFVVDSNIRKYSGMLQNLFEDIPEIKCEIPMPNVNTKIMGIIAEWYTHTMEVEKTSPKPTTPPTESPVKTFNPIDGTMPEVVYDDWQVAFLERFVTSNDCLEVMMAANYLDMEQLINAMVHRFVELLKPFTNVEDMRKFLGVEKDFTDEEEQKMLKEMEWCFNVKEEVN